jgi:hypothetical protein
LQDEPGGKPGLDFGCVFEAERSKRGLCARAVAAGDHEVEVAVGSRLLADEGIDAPAAVKPDGEVLKARQSSTSSTSAGPSAAPLGHAASRSVGSPAASLHQIGEVVAAEVPSTRLGDQRGHAGRAQQETPASVARRGPLRSGGL